ncbi:MAG TPA: tetratricopeptide repeat protein [Polyangia bacterium]|nr:tetratricopeptide repeat protein [Polyangia bacterium]
MSVRRALRWLIVIVALEAAAALAGCTVEQQAAHPTTPADLARMKMAREMTERGDWANAFALLDELHRKWPQDAEVLTLRGTVYRERGLFHDAEEDLKGAMKAAPDDAEAHAALGILYDVQMRPDAEAEHKTAVRLAPQNPAYLNNLGFSLFLRQHYKEAIKQYEKAARLAPLSRRVRTNMGFAYAAIGDLPSAAREFQMGGTAAEAKNNLGFAYERRGDLANAYQLYLDAVRIDPAATHAHSNLVHAAALLGRPVPPEAAPPLSTPSQKDAPTQSEDQHDHRD